jgi:L-phenylalanine/L-methionine N-acetyltransferase
MSDDDAPPADAPAAPWQPADAAPAQARWRLRRAQATDAPAFARMMSDPGVFPQVLQMPYANEERWRHMLAEPTTASPPKLDLHLVADVDGEVVASAGLHPANHNLRRRHAMGLGITVRSDWQGRGLGHALMHALLDYADRWAGVLRVELTVYADNLRAQALYRRHGFVEEGRHRAYALRDGVYVDALAMARLHPSPPGL